jgi:P4 family phage/plasmid primase-like protien
MENDKRVTDKNLNKLFALMEKHHSGKGCEHNYTHFGIVNGKPIFKSYFFPPKKQVKFLTLYNKVYNKIAGCFHFTEKPKPVSPFFIDIDWHFKKKRKYKKRKYQRDVKCLVKQYNKLIKKYLVVNDDDIEAYVFEKDAPSYCEKTADYSDGVHIMYPFIALSPDVKYVINCEVAEYSDEHNLLEDVPYCNEDDTVFDLNVIEYTNWMLYGSAKKDRDDPYKVTHIYNHKSEEIDIDALNDIDDLPGFFSVRQYDEEDETKVKDKYLMKLRDRYLAYQPKKKCKSKTVNVLDASKNDGKHRKYIDDIKIKKIPKGELSNDAKRAAKLLALLKESRASNHGEWSVVGWCLRNISDQLLEYWIAFSQQCPESFDYDSCMKIWNEARDEGKRCKMSALEAWAKEDDIEGFKELIKQETPEIMQRTISGTGTNCDVAEVVKEIYKNLYVCSNLEPKPKWYEFQKHHWELIEKGYTLSTKISSDVVTDFLNLRKYCYAQMSDMVDTGPGQYKDMTKDVAKIDKIIEKLKTTRFKREVMEECSRLFYDSTFPRDIDEGRFLIGFDNGVFDLERMSFRPGMPDDYITLSVGYDFIEYTGDEPVFDEINGFFEKIQCKKNVREYVFRACAAHLVGGNRENIVFFWTGTGSNGKSTAMRLLKKVFGKYFGTAPITLITRKQKGAGSATPELASLKGVRMLSLNEPEGDENIFSSMLKQLSGEDDVSVRQLYEKCFDYTPQFMMNIICNDLPRIVSVDGGTWRRPRVIPWESEFVEKESDVTEDYQFVKDLSVVSRMDDWVQPFMWLLITKYFPDYLKNGLREPKEVIEKTQGYQKDSDVYQQFIMQSLVKGKRSDKEDIKFIYKLFKEWHIESYSTTGVPNRTEFKDYLTKRGYIVKKNMLIGYKIAIEDTPDEMDACDDAGELD